MLASLLLALLAALLGVGAGALAAVAKAPDWLCQIITLAVFGVCLLWLPGVL